MNELKTTQAQRKAAIKWKKNNYVQLPIDVRPEDKERIKAAATAANMTVRAYILEAVEEKINRDIGTH